MSGWRQGDRKVNVHVALAHSSLSCIGLREPYVWWSYGKGSPGPTQQQTCDDAGRSKLLDLLYKELFLIL